MGWFDAFSEGPKKDRVKVISKSVNILGSVLKRYSVEKAPGIIQRATTRHSDADRASEEFENREGRRRVDGGSLLFPRLFAGLFVPAVSSVTYARLSFLSSAMIDPLKIYQSYVKNPRRSRYTLRFIQHPTR